MGGYRWLAALAVALFIIPARIAGSQANPAAGLVLTPATFSILNPSIFGDNAPVVVGGGYGNRPNARSYLFSGSLSHVRFQFGRTFWPVRIRAKTLMSGIDYAHAIASAEINPAVRLVSGFQTSAGYGLINDLNGLGTEGFAAGVLIAAGVHLSGPGFGVTPYLSPAYFFAHQALVGYECGSPPGCSGLTASGGRLTFGGGLRIDLLRRLSLEAGVRKTQTRNAISRRSFGVSYRFGNMPGRGLRDAGSFTLQMDNDFLARTSSLLDEDYTQGFHFVFNRKASSRFLEHARDHLGDCSPDSGCENRASTLVGQEIYTPQYYPAVAANDRPYGGWLYGGMRSTAATDHHLTALTIKFGVTGPPSFAQQLQITFHELQPSYIIPAGWNDQLKFEPGVIVTAEKKKFFGVNAGLGSLGLIGSGSASVGNILTDLEAGLKLVAGLNDRHPWMLAKKGGFGVHASFGARQDLVVRNLFLDGNTFRSGPRVKRIPFVWQKDLGAGVSFGSICLDYQKVVRSREFTTGRRHQPFGTIAVTRRGQF